MPGPIVCVTESREGALRRVSFEVVAAGRALAEGGLGAVTAVGVGDDRASPDVAAASIAAHARATGARAVLFAASAFGRDLAPRVAALLDAPVVVDVTALCADGDTIVATRPVYAGKALQDVAVAAAPVVLSVRPGAFQPAAGDLAATPEVVPTADAPVRTRLTGVTRPERAALDVTEAPVVVSGGRGLGEPANFRLVEELAAAFGAAAVGASRAVVDAGWRDHGEQVGQTGKTVSPRLYVAVGISGAIQHLAGMRTSQTIVAINRDKDAPIFKVADYGIVGDLFEVVPALAAAVRARRGG